VSNPVTVAIIDSGANTPHPHLPEVVGGVAFDLEGRASGDFADRLGHGTAAAAAVHEKAPRSELHIVKVFDRELATTVSTLVRAIDWASERGCRIINLSLGTPNDFREAELEPAVVRAVDRGSLIVSVHEHEDRLWYPGSMPGVLGVIADPDQPREKVAVVSREGGPVLRAAPYPRPIAGVPLDRNLNGISFAVANVTGVIARLLDDAPDVRVVEDVVALVAADRPV